MTENQEFLNYKGKPLVRSGNTLYYGNMSDKYIVMLQILGSEKKGELDIGNKIVVQLLYTDLDLKPRDRVVKKSEKSGLYEAMDIGSIWLERALAE